MSKINWNREGRSDRDDRTNLIAWACRDVGEVSVYAGIHVWDGYKPGGGPTAGFRLIVARTSGKVRKRTSRWEWSYLTFAAALAEAEECFETMRLPETDHGA